MTREEVKKLLPIIEAFAEGKQIEIKPKVKDANWSTLEIDAIRILTLTSVIYV